MVIQCINLISLYILPDQRRVNLLVFTKTFPSCSHTCLHGEAGAAALNDVF